ncbi:MAG: NYN domain-containing protein [Pirellulales bacterium]
MSLRILIDGYNLLYSSAWLQKGGGPRRLEAARERLIRGLSLLLTEEERRDTQLVFDAAEAPRDLPEEFTQQGMTITFARDFHQADDLIEQIIRHHPHPKKLLVVSGDHRIGRCAKAARAQWIEAERWLSEVARRRDSQPPTDLLGDKQAILGDAALLNSEEVHRWLQDFGLPHSHASSASTKEPTSAVPSAPVSPPVVKKRPAKNLSPKTAKPKLPPKPNLPSKPLSPHVKQQAQRVIEEEHPSLDEILKDIRDE